MTARRVLHADADIRAAGRDLVRSWRAAGWTLPDHRAEHVAAILAPDRGLLQPGPDTRAA